MGDDRDLLRELAEIFLLESPRLMGEIRAAIAEGDPRKLKSAAHSLKGSVDNFAAKGAFEQALRLEMLGRHGKLSGAQEACAALESEIDRIKPILSSLAQEGKPSSSK
jgi:HPt (histidine-containing phosphotransfer) domain-containing protein